MITNGNSTENYKLVSQEFSKILEQQLCYNNSYWLNVHSGDIKAYNLYNGSLFSWLNQLLLNKQCNINGYKYNRWVTLDQAQKLGATLKDINQKPSFVTTLTERHYDITNGNDITGVIEMFNNIGVKPKIFKYGTVKELDFHEIYNICQFDGWQKNYFLPGIRVRSCERLREIMLREFIFNSGPIVHESSSNDCTNHQDHLIIRRRENFTGPTEYCEHLLYRLCEWAKPKILPNNYYVTGLPYGTIDTLINEFFSCFICCDLGFEMPVSKNPGFVCDWIKGVNADHHLLVKSILYAGEVFDFVRCLNSGRIKPTFLLQDLN